MKTGEMVVPDVIGEVLAWRAWNVIEAGSDHPRLVSATARGGDDEISMQKIIWPTNRWIVAECAAHGDEPGHVIPERSCSCGLYAARDMDQLLDLGYANWHGGPPTVVGQVGFAGKVVPGSQGWRAARGRIVHLWIPFSQAAMGEKLAAQYNVPVDFGPWWATDPRLGIARRP